MKTVYVLLREERHYAGDTTVASMVLEHVFGTESKAEEWLQENVREPLHRDYEIEEREVIE